VPGHADDKAELDTTPDLGALSESVAKAYGDQNYLGVNLGQVSK
jgi:hypothetical protein